MSWARPDWDNCQFCGVQTCHEPQLDFMAKCCCTGWGTESTCTSRSRWDKCYDKCCLGEVDQNVTHAFDWFNVTVQLHGMFFFLYHYGVCALFPVYIRSPTGLLTWIKTQTDGALNWLWFFYIDISVTHIALLQPQQVLSLALNLATLLSLLKMNRNIKN